MLHACETLAIRIMNVEGQWLLFSATTSEPCVGHEATDTAFSSGSRNAVARSNLVVTRLRVTHTLDCAEVWKLFTLRPIRCAAMRLTE